MLLKLNKEYIKNNIIQLTQVIDYVPINFKEYNAQETRNEFLKTQNLNKTIPEMKQLIQKKCEYYTDTDKAINSILIEWIDCHPEFEEIIAPESIVEYQTIKNNNDFIEFIDLIYDVELPSEKEKLEKEIKKRIEKEYPEGIIVKDDSHIKLSDFNKMKSFSEEYGDSLLTEYLSYSLL